MGGRNKVILIVKVMSCPRTLQEPQKRRRRRNRLHADAEDDVTLTHSVCMDGLQVPRLYNCIYAKIRAATIDAPGARGTLFRKVVAGRKWLVWELGEARNMPSGIEFYLIKCIT
jgi:hypothetical protein